jgi:hypothetical protein
MRTIILAARTAVCAAQDAKYIVADAWHVLTFGPAAAKHRAAVR